MKKNLIIGFYLGMNYSCTECKSFCCSSDYEMPIFSFEEELYIQTFPEIQPFIKKSLKNQNTLLRSNSCFFLASDGLCNIHKELGRLKKPLVCQIYPLIFVKYPDFIFTYKYPCKGMKWVTPYDENQKINEIDIVSSKIDREYNIIFSDQVDGYNPFMYIENNRILEINKIFNQKKDVDMKSRILLETKNIEYELEEFVTLYTFFIQNFDKNLKYFMKYEKKVEEYEKSLLFWLHFNPFFLALNINNALLLSIFAINYFRDLLQTQISLSKNGKADIEIIKEKSELIAWNVVEIVTEEWWHKLLNHYIPYVLPIKWSSLITTIKSILKKNYLPFPE